MIVRRRWRRRERERRKLFLRKFLSNCKSFLRWTPAVALKCLKYLICMKLSFIWRTPVHYTWLFWYFSLVRVSLTIYLIGRVNGRAFVDCLFCNCDTVTFTFLKFFYAFGERRTRLANLILLFVLMRVQQVKIEVSWGMRLRTFIVINRDVLIIKKKLFEVYTFFLFVSHLVSSSQNWHSVKWYQENAKKNFVWNLKWHKARDRRSMRTVIVDLKRILEKRKSSQPTRLFFVSPCSVRFTRSDKLKLSLLLPFHSLSATFFTLHAKFRLISSSAIYVLNRTSSTEF